MRGSPLKQHRQPTGAGLALRVVVDNPTACMCARRPAGGRHSSPLPLNSSCKGGQRVIPQPDRLAMLNACVGATRSALLARGEDATRRIDLLPAAGSQNVSRLTRLLQGAATALSASRRAIKTKDSPAQPPLRPC